MLKCAATPFAIGLIAVLAIPPAGAASFDCGKAGTAFERAVCSDPGLSHQDDVLAQAYATALGGLSKTALDNVKAQQHAWLAYAERVCTDQARPQAGDYDGDGIACLGSTFASRLRQLEASRMLGGFRFYPIDRFAVLPDPDATPDSYNKVADKNFSSVMIDSTGPVALAFNAMIKKDMATYSDFLDAEGQIDLEWLDASSDVTISSTVSEVRSRRISLNVDYYWYGHGAAHGNYAITYLHFLTQELRPLRADDIFSGADWKTHLGQLVTDALQRTVEGGVWEEALKDIPDWAADPARWNFSDEGLIVQFQPYEVTAYAMGAPKVTIGWEVLSNDVSEHALEIAAY